MEVPETFYEKLDPTVLKRKKVIQELYLHDRRFQGYLETPRALQEVMARYWGKVTLVDEMVGHVLDKLRESGLEENTIVVFTSEHGELMGDHRMMHKMVMYEESVTVPLLLRVPGLKDGTQRVSKAVSLVDLVPTLLDLMKQPLPALISREKAGPRTCWGGKTYRSETCSLSLMDGSEPSWKNTQTAFAAL